MGSFSDWWSSTTTATPSAAPKPTVVKTGTTLKTGTVLNSKDDPVVFTPNDDGGYTGQNESTLPAAEPATFGDAFAENRAAGKDTFVYNGNLYTTEVAERLDDGLFSNYDVLPSTSTSGLTEVELPNGRSYYADESGTFIGLVPENVALDPRGEDDLMSQEVVGAAGQEYADSLPAFSYDFTADDTPSEDDLMSQEVVGPAGQDYADSLPDFSYDFTADDTPSVTSGGRNLDADLGVGGSSATVSAADLAAFNADPFGGDYGEGIIEGGNIAAIPLDGGGNLLVNDSSNIYDKINADAAAAVDSRSVFEKAQDAFFDDRNVIDRKVSDAASNLLNASGAVNSYGSPLPGDDVVADASGGFGNMTQEQFVAAAGPTAVDIVAAAPPAKYYDAFGNEFSTPDAAGESDRAAEAAAAAAIAKPQNPFVDDLLSALKGTDPVSQAGFDLAKSFAIGVPSNAADMFGGIADFVESRPVSGSGNAMVDLGYELYSRLNPNMTQEAILSADPSISEQRPTVQGARAVESGLQSAADYLTERFFPEGRDQAVVTGTTPSELAIETVSGEGGGTGLAGTVTEEMGGGVIDILGSVNFPARLASAGLNIGEQLSGTEATTREALTQLVNSGALADNERYQKVLASQGGDVEKAITAITRANTYSTAPQTAGTGVFDAAVPKFAKGLLGTAKDFAVRTQIEGGQEVAENVIALSGLNSILNLPEDKALQPLKDASGNYVMGAITGGGTSILASPVVNAIGSKTDSDNATPAPNVLNPSQFPTAGQPAQSTVKSSYDEAGISGASDTMRSEIAPDKLTVAEELMMNQLEDEGAIDLNQLRDLGLTLFEMQSVADSAITKKMDADANMLQFVAEQEAIDNNGAISAELVDEIQTKLSPELAAEVIETASNAPYVDASGQSRMDIFLNNQTPSSLPAAPTEGIAPKVDTTSVGAASIAKAPASGIETVVAEQAKGPDAIIAEQRAAAPAQPETPVVKARDVLSQYNEEIAARPAGNYRSNLLTDASLIQEFVKRSKSYDPLKKGDTVNIAEISKRTPGGLINLSDSYGDITDPKKITAAQKRLEKAGILGPVDSNGNQELLADVARDEGLSSTNTAAIDKKMDADNAAPVKTFTTAKGSTYDAFGDGTTVRNRAERTKFGRPDGEVSGVQPRSQQTVFMTKEAANEIGPLFQNTEVPTELVIEGDKARLVLKEDVGPRKAGSDYSKTVTLSTEPEVGLQPVEIMNTSNDDSRNIHFGNEITEVSTVDATQAITKKMDADNAAPAIKKEDVAAVVEVAKSPDDIIAEQRQKSLIADLVLSDDLFYDNGEQLASQLGVDVETAKALYDEAFESMTSGEIDAAAAAAAEKAGLEAYDNFKPTTTLGKTTGILSAKDEAARKAAFDKAYEDALAASRKDLFVGTGSDNADNAATEVKLPVAEETAAVVTEKADGSADVELSEGSTSKTVVEKDGDSKTTRKTGAAVTETETGATVELTPEQEVQAVEELYQKADSEIDNATDVKAVEELYQKADSEIDALTGIDTEAATDTSTDTTTDIKVLTEVGEFPEPEVEVEVEEEEVEPGGDVTVDLDEDDTFVPVITSTDENGETITECPEGYTMVEGPDGPMCQKSVTTTVRRQRAGASTRAYTGLSGNRGRVGPGQRSRSNTTTTTETVDPTTRSA